MGALDKQPAAPATTPGASGRAAAASSPVASAADAAAATPGLLLSIPAAVLNEVHNGQQTVVAQGPLSVLILDAWEGGTWGSPAVAPATPTAPAEQPRSGKLYPELHQESASSTASTASIHGSSEGSAAEGGSGGAATAGQGASIVLAVADVAIEILPASQTLKVGELTWVFSTHDPDSYLASPEGLFLTVTLASDTEAEAVGMLEGLLEACSIYRESAALLSSSEAAVGEAALASQCAYKSSVARGVHTASRKVAGGLLASATYASSSISRGAAYFTPAQATAAPVSISPGVKKRFAQTARLAGYASKAVNSAVSGLAYVGAKVAGGALWMVGANKPLKPGEEAGTLREVSQAAVLGFTQVWDSMEEAGQTVLLSARDSTAGVMRQRYGPDAEEVSLHSMNAAGYTTEAAFAARKIGVRTVAKAAAKKTAKGVIHKWAGIESAGSLPGSRGSSRGGSRGGSADNLAAAGGSAAAEPAGVGVAQAAGGSKAKQA